MPLELDTSFGPYRILALLGAGGMGEVYRARDTTLKRDVALKVVPAAFVRDPERMARFQREAEVLASLDHPNIGPIYGLVESEGARALVLALIEGPTLADHIEAGALPQDEAIAIAKQIIEALEYAHDRGVVHRDLKPANVKITTDGVVKVLDFGLAKVLEDELPKSSLANSPTLTLGHTRAGMILGTAAYMSPEQAVGRPVDRRSDIFSFGAVLYEMLTGKRAFAGAATPDVLEGVVKTDPDWSKLPSETPGAIEKLLRRCLVKDRKQRLQAIGEARIILNSPLETVGQVPDLPAKSTKLPGAVAAAVICFLAAAALAFIHFREKPPVAEVVRFQISPPPGTRAVTALRLSPDGRRLAFFGTSPGGTTSQLWVHSLDTLESKPLAGTEGVAGFEFWSPDSRFIAFEAQRKLKKVDMAGGPPQTVCDLSGPSRGGAWSPGGVVVFGTGKGIMRVLEAGGAASPVTNADPSRPSQDEGGAFLPDGRHFLYFQNSIDAEGGIYLASLDAKPGQQSTRRLVAADSWPVFVASPDSAVGHLLFAREDTLMVQPFDTSRMELTGDAVPIAEGLNAGSSWFSASTTGVLAYQTGGTTRTANTQLTSFDRGGKNLGTAGEPGEYNTLALSPDGTQVAFDRTEPRAVGSGRPRGNYDIWVYEFARGTSTRLTSDPTIDGGPVWSPDGSRIVFFSGRDGSQYNLYQKASSGAGSEDALFKSSEAKFTQDWSQDGRFLMYSAQGQGSSAFHLWVLPLEGERKPTPYLKSEFTESQGRFSPDGHFVAYSSNSSGKREIYVQPFPNPQGGKWIVSKGGGGQPRWRRDGKELFYISADSKMMAVEVSTAPVFKAGVPKVLFPAPIFGGGNTNNVTRYDVTADGKKFLINSVLPEASAPALSPITVVLNWTALLKK